MRDALEMAQKVHGGVRPEVFKRLAAEVTGKELPDRVVSILYCVFDADGDGTLDVAELDVAISNRALDAMGQVRPEHLFPHALSPPPRHLTRLARVRPRTGPPGEAGRLLELYQGHVLQQGQHACVGQQAPCGWESGKEGGGFPRPPPP